MVYNSNNDNLKRLTTYSDVDYASCLDTRKSGIVLILNNGPVAWLFRKQSIVATSTTDAEYVVAYDAAKEIVWFRQLLKDIGVNQHGPTTLYCDNATAEKLIQNPIFYKRCKHIDKV